MDKTHALKLLTDNCPKNVVAHSIAVSKKAVEMGQQLKEKGYNVNLSFIETASLLHDIGRSKTHGIMHGLEGSKMLCEYPQHARVCETHIGAGITKDESVKLELPKKDYLPVTLEEKIICLADKLTKEDKFIRIEDAVKIFETKLGKHHPVITRMINLNNEIELLLRK